jgi:hypothetical protein
MEPDCSLPCSQQPFTTPYLEPDESSPRLPILFIYYLLLGLTNDLFFARFPINRVALDGNS